MDDIIKILKDNIAAVFALIGALAGSAISIIGTLLINEKDLKLRLKEKVLNRRIEAHEKIIQLSKTIRTMVSLGKTDEAGELARYPAMLGSLKAFDEWQAYFVEIVSSQSTWLSVDVTRELNLFQDYIVNLREMLRKTDNNDCIPAIGAIIRNDFVSFSDKIEKLAFKYFNQDLSKMKMGDITQWHKYTLEETKTKLHSTALLTEQEKINAIISQSNRASKV